MVNCDVCSTFPLHDLLISHLNNQGLGTMLVKKTFEGGLDATEFGNAICESKSLRLLHYTDKPENRVGDYINAGVYAFSPKIFEHIERVRDAKASTGSRSCETLSLKEYIRLDNDIFAPLAGHVADSTDQLFVHSLVGFWEQIKHPGIALKCSEEYLNQYREIEPDILTQNHIESPEIIGNVYIHESASVHKNAKIGPNVTIGSKVNIGAGARLRDCIILDGVKICENAYVSRAIIGWNSKLGQWSRVEGAGSYSDRLGVTILGEAVIIEDEIIVSKCIVLPNKTITFAVRNDIIL